MTHPVFGRTIVVLASDGQLAVALRERVDRAYATVIDAMTSDAGDVEALRPAPWMVVGQGVAIGARDDGGRRATSTLVAWLGPPPPGLPAHAVVLTRFAEVVAEVKGRISRAVAGMRLSPGDGVTMPDGAHQGNRLLEALVSAHPDPVPGVAAGRDVVDVVLAEHNVAMRTAAVAGGRIRLVPLGGTLPASAL